MTTYLDYKTLPAENNGPPPVGAPEQMPTSAVNNVLREIMSVIRQLGDKGTADIAALGTMSIQDADAVAITGGVITATLNGPGAGITNLKAQNLIEGPIPKEVFPVDATPLDVKVARAGVADSLGSSLSILPIGTVLMWYSANPVPTGWQICDGTNGTPDLRAKFPLGTGSGVALGQAGGAWQASAATDAQGSHAHGGGTAGAVLGIEHMPSHSHTEFSLIGAGGSFIGPVNTNDGQAGVVANIPTQPAGGGVAHAHVVGADGSHQHNVTVTTQPPYLGIHFIMRIS